MSDRIALIGAGNMGAALLRGILASDWGRDAALVASHPKTQKASALAAELAIPIVSDNREAAKGSPVVILAVKPQLLESVLREILPVLRDDQLLLSIAAGFGTER